MNEKDIVWEGETPFGKCRVDSHGRVRRLLHGSWEDPLWNEIRVTALTAAVKAMSKAPPSGV